MMQMAAVLDNRTQTLEFTRAADVPALGHAEAADVARAELERFLSLLQTLEGDDWIQPTYCTEWDVKQIVQHELGGYQSGARFRELLHQQAGRKVRAYVKQGLSQLDATNRLQVEERAHLSPNELIRQLKIDGPRAIENRYKLPGLLRALRLPLGPLGIVRLDYLTDVIYSRDTWMHRIDIAHAAGRPFVATPDHDGRIQAVIMRDLAHTLTPTLGTQSVLFVLTGEAGGRWLVGVADHPAATIELSFIDFNLLASGRIPVDAGVERSRLTGDQQLARAALAATHVEY